MHDVLDDMNLLLRVPAGHAATISRAFADEADRMAGLLRAHAARLVTEPALGDPASREFAAALNQRLVDGDDSYLRRALRYVDDLHAAARHCAALAEGNDGV